MPIVVVPRGTIKDENDPLHRFAMPSPSLPSQSARQDVSFKLKGTDTPLLGYDPAASQALKVRSSSPIEGLNFDEVPRSGNSENSREHMGPRGAGHHAGLDIPAKVGTPVVAPSDATVLRMGTGTGYGQYVDAQMSDGTVHRFAHLGDMSKGGNVSPFSPGVKPGDSVKAGTTLGFSGFSGNATSDFPHVHAEVFRNSSDYNKYGFSTEGSRNTAYGRLDPRTYYTEGLSSAVTKQNELYTKIGMKPGAPPPTPPAGDLSAQASKGTPLPVGGDGVFKSPSGQEIRNGIDPNAPYMSRPRSEANISRIIMHGDVVQDADKLLKYGRQVDTGRSPPFDPGYHFYIGKDGTVTQGAPLDRITNHALGENKDTIGIVIAGADNGRMPTDAQNAAAMRLVSDLGTQYKIDPQNVMGHGELQPNRRNALEGGRVASTIRTDGYLPPNATPPQLPSSPPAPEEPKKPISITEAAGMTPPARAAAAPPPTSGQPAPVAEPSLMASARTFAATGDTPEPGPLANQEAQPGSQGSAPITEMPGTVVTSQAVPPGAMSPRLDAPDAIASTSGQPQQPAAAPQVADAGSLLDNWKPGQPIVPAILGDIFGGGASEGGGGGLFGGGGGKAPAFKNMVQVPNLPDLGQQLLQSAGPEPSGLPSNIPPPPPAPPLSPAGHQTPLQLLQARRHRLA
jgi:murein DD-endopeptidase MepM/ murein hydrolase activator NlpD